MLSIIKEGKAVLKVPTGEKISSSLAVFYNPVMKFNRDISVLLLQCLGRKNLSFADILSASGARGIRLALELKKGIIGTMVLNDQSKKAFGNIRQNLSLNGLGKDRRIAVKNMDANELLQDSSGFDVIDIDPFGSPNFFLWNSLKKIKRNGILAVTATDTGALAGAFPEAGIRKYWAIPLKNEFMHETGLRILARKVQLVASQLDRAAVPILSFYRDHYYRIIFRIEHGARKADKAMRGYKCILYCRNCTSRWVINEMSPAKTGNIGKDSKCCKDPKFEKAGPMWCNAMGDPGLADKMAAKSANEKDRKFLSVLASEYKSGIVGFYDIHRICKISHLEIPRKEDLRNALIKQGNQSVATHVSGTAIKTDASLHSIIRTIRSLNRKKK
ncbi:tRNA (guanine(10)-N(2))-dimethyltransferase [Candidatus Woesearchaeota archaeon]|nr:tRNA (guanine(10)-N(2))-dimethyltransferase [Candidatus Woesearchaeota archaeon]